MGSGQEKRKGSKKNGGENGDEPESRGDEDEPDTFDPVQWLPKMLGRCSRCFFWGVFDYVGLMVLWFCWLWRLVWSMEY